MAREFVNKYDVSTITHLADIKIYEYYSVQEYNELVDDVINKLKDKLEEYRKSFINDITYIYNLNELEELSDLTPIQRLHILRSSKKESETQKIYDETNLKLTLNNFGDLTYHIKLKEEDGEIASTIAIQELKEWFENLTIEQKKLYYKDISKLKKVF